MYNRLIYFSFAILLLISTAASGQLMRMAIMPQRNITISKSQQPALVGLGLDYYRMAPNAANVPNQPVYNQIYGSADVIVKINNKPTRKTFQNLVEGENALLLLQPLSKDRIHAEINSGTPEGQQVESIELEILAPIEIGYIKSEADANVKQANIIFKNFGLQLNSTEYFNRALCMDIMQQNNKLVYNDALDLSPASLQLLNKLHKTINCNTFPPRDFNNIISNGFITITDDGELTKESIAKLQQVIYYQPAITTTQALNTSWKVKNTTEMKTMFYRDSYILTKPSDNTKWKDTMINGERYVLMIGWKNSNFTTQPYVITKDGRQYFKSDSTFFRYPMFLALEGEMEQWIKSHNINKDNPTEYKTRLMQLLGLTPNSTNDLFAEIWARESDIFRPAIDSSLTLNGIISGMDSTYLQSLIGYSNGSFSSPLLMKNYPFTGLGYTWDWSPENKTHIGLNEFVVKPARQLLIRRTLPTHEYLMGIK